MRITATLGYTNSAVATVLDDVRGYVARASNRNEDTIEEADTALAGVASQLFVIGEAAFIYLVTTDIDAGEGTVNAVDNSGYDGEIEVVDRFKLISTIMS